MTEKPHEIPARRGKVIDRTRGLGAIITDNIGRLDPDLAEQIYGAEDAKDQVLLVRENLRGRVGAVRLTN